MRIATVDDLGALTAIDPIASANDHDRLALLRRGIESGCCLMYVDETNKVLGFVVTTARHFFGRDFVELLTVAPLVRRCGVGRALLKAAVNSAATPQVFTSTNESNSPMRGLLGSEGWAFSGQLDGLDDGDPELVFFTLRHGTLSVPEP